MIILSLEDAQHPGIIYDRITVDEAGQIVYQTGSGADVIAQLRRLTGLDGQELLEAAKGWTNTYASLIPESG